MDVLGRVSNVVEDDHPAPSEPVGPHPAGRRPARPAPASGCRAAATSGVARRATRSTAAAPFASLTDHLDVGLAVQGSGSRPWPHHAPRRPPRAPGRSRRATRRQHRPDPEAAGSGTGLGEQRAAVRRAARSRIADQPAARPRARCPPAVPPSSARPRPRARSRAGSAPGTRDGARPGVLAPRWSVLSCTTRYAARSRPGEMLRGVPSTTRSTGVPASRTRAAELVGLPEARPGPLLLGIRGLEDSGISRSSAILRRPTSSTEDSA